MNISYTILGILGRRNYRRVSETFDMRFINRYNFSFDPVNEAVVRTLAPKEKGGIVVFSTDVNAELVTDRYALVRAVKRFWLSLRNRVRRYSKIDRVLASVSADTDEAAPTGISVGNLFKGRYKSPEGQVYDEKSLAVEVLFISGRQLIELTTKLAAEFRQETVLVKDNATHEVYLLDGSPILGESAASAKPAANTGRKLPCGR